MSPTDSTVPGALILTPAATLNGLRRSARLSPLKGGRWHEVESIGAGFDYVFPKGALAAYQYLTCDMLVEGSNAVYFQIKLSEGEGGPFMCLAFSFLNYCQGRVRMALEAVNQNRWMYPREASWLKPLCGGTRVSLDKVDRLRLEVLRKSEAPANFCMTPLQAVCEAPELLQKPLLPRGPLLDELGQCTFREWAGKIKSAEELQERLQERLKTAAAAKPPAGLSRWGGWLEKRFAATGFFRVERDEQRFWLVDPEGCAFWSSGMDCVRERNFATPVTGLEKSFAWLPDRKGPYAAAFSPDGESVQASVELHVANLIRVFGADWRKRWETLAVGGLTEAGFNTIGNWSDEELAARRAIPYVRPIKAEGSRTPHVFRDFPDVFAPEFDADAADVAAALVPTRNDPALIGYFLGNEPTWGFAELTPAEGMLINTDGCHSRVALRRWLEAKHGTEAALTAAWGMPVTWAALETGRWTAAAPAAAKGDLEAFSTVMVARMFDRLRDACRKVDPNHLNLGARYYTVPPVWAIAGMQAFDVFSINCYKQEVPDSIQEQLVAVTGKPVLVGEWHFGALDAGLPASGIGRVKDQAARGAAFRFYVERAAAKPWCIGVHYFTLYDQSANGRFDGENYNIGFFDVCEQPYAPLVTAARRTHERLYAVAAGKVPPFAEPPEHLPMLFY